jgi:hypothetical protein
VEVLGERLPLGFGATGEGVGEQHRLVEKYTLDLEDGL